MYKITSIICKFTFKLRLHLNYFAISQRFLTFWWNDFCMIPVAHSTKHHLKDSFLLILLVFPYLCHASSRSLQALKPKGRFRYLRTVLYIYISDIVVL